MLNPNDRVWMPCLESGVDLTEKREKHRNQRFLVPSRRRNISTNDRDPRKDDLAALGPDIVIWMWYT